MMAQFNRLDQEQIASAGFAITQYKIRCVKELRKNKFID
jgi:hypothetical protein